MTPQQQQILEGLKLLPVAHQLDNGVIVAFLLDEYQGEHGHFPTELHAIKISVSPAGQILSHDTKTYR